MKTFISHLEELRKRVVYVLIIWALLFAICIFFNRHIIRAIISQLPNQVELIATSPINIISAQLKLDFFLSLLLIIPIVIVEVINYVRPALKKKERKYLLWVPLSIILFYTGFAAGLVFIGKIGLHFLAANAISLGIANMWEINETISFVFIISFILGLCFQLPLVLTMLAKMGLVNSQKLIEHRKLAYVLVFVISAILTPTVDPVTQIFVSLPLIFLYELSLLLTRL